MGPRVLFIRRPHTTKGQGCCRMGVGYGNPMSSQENKSMAFKCLRSAFISLRKCGRYPNECDGGHHCASPTPSPDLVNNDGQESVLGT